MQDKREKQLHPYVDESKICELRLDVNRDNKSLLRLLKPYHIVWGIFSPRKKKVYSGVRSHESFFFFPLRTIFLKFQDITKVVFIKAKFDGFCFRNLLDIQTQRVTIPC